MKFLKALKKGFTLVELVIVIAVIAVLSAVLIPVFGNVIKSSKVSALKSDLNTCTNTLVMYSLYNDVDYYTPAVVREFLKSEKIDGLTSSDSKYCLDGYSVWYNQKTFNFQLIKNSEISKYIDRSAASASYSNISTYSIGLNRGNTAHYTSSGTSESGATDVVSTLPRRPEAITPDRNMLLIATDEANKGILEGIEKLYYLADNDKQMSSGENLIIEVQRSMQGSELMYSIDNWNISKYTDEFAPSKTAWLNNVGQFITEATFDKDNGTLAEITNVIVSPNLGNATLDNIKGSSIDGGIYSFDERVNPQVGKKLKINCAIEIATFDFDVTLGQLFYNTFYEGGANIVISGKVSVANNVSAGGSSTTTVSTVTGGGSNISSAVSAGGGSATPGGGSSGSKYISKTMTSEEFNGWTSPKQEGGKATIECSNVTKIGDGDNAKYKVSVKTPDGKVETKEVTNAELNAYFENNKVGDTVVDYKYNTSSFSINLHEFLNESLGIESDDDIISIEITDSAYRGVYSTSVFMLYKVDGVTYGKTFNFGVGYITNFDHYYRYYSESFDAANSSGENIYPTYYEVNGSERTTDAGSITIKLPDRALNLQTYKNEDFSIEVEYYETTKYYRKDKSVFGTDYYEFLGSCSGVDVKSVVWEKSDDGKKIGNCYALNFGKHKRITSADNNFSGATYFVNTVSIKRIIVRDKSDNILIVKYPSAN